MKEAETVDDVGTHDHGVLSLWLSVSTSKRLQGSQVDGGLSTLTFGR